MLAVLCAVMPAAAVIRGHTTLILVWVLIVASVAAGTVGSIARRRGEDGLGIVLYGGGCVFACCGWAWMAVIVIAALVGDRS
ncbi:MAG: hypothetical protein ACHQEA_15340 [Gaiellales bacterium]